MSCRHNLALGTCKECYPETGTITPKGPGDSMDGPGAIAQDGNRLPDVPPWMEIHGPPDPEHLPLPNDQEAVAASSEDIGSIAELNDSGDTKYTWNRKNPRECEAAHEHFEMMKAKGFLIFKVQPFGRKSKNQIEHSDPKDGGYVYVEGKAPTKHPYRAEVAKDFDPKENYVATPMVVGG